MANVARQAEVAARRTKAIKMRLAGKRWEDIAEACGYAHRGAAQTDIAREMQQRLKTEVEGLDQLRQVELERLDELWAKAWEVLHSDAVTVSHGKVIYVTDPDTGERVPVPDRMPTLQAIDRLVRIAERRAKLGGLDQPVKIETDSVVRYEVIGVNPSDLGEPARERVVIEDAEIIPELEPASGE